MDKYKIVEILKSHYPDSPYIADSIIDAKYISGVLIIDLNDGDSAIYRCEENSIAIYKRSDPAFASRKGTSDSRMKSVFRDLKLTEIIDE